MSSRQAFFKGWVVLLNDRGIVSIDIYADDPPYVDVYVNDELADDITSKLYLADEYGNTFYDTFEDARSNNNPKSIEDVWPDVSHG